MSQTIKVTAIIQQISNKTKTNPKARRENQIRKLPRKLNITKCKNQKKCK